MAIDTSKLVPQVLLQNFLEDKVGVPMSAGVVTFYRDSDQVTLKNVYQQTGTYGNYSYVAVDNPMTLSAAGTTVDVDGNDILLYFYPYDETDSSIPQAYFITVYDSNGTFQFSRSNFPFTTSSGPSPTNTVPDYQQYIINNRFWRNIGGMNPDGSYITYNAGTLGTSLTYQYNNTGTYYYVTVAPSQHDGFSIQDINYIKNANGNCTETITFKQFAQTSVSTTLPNDIAPQYYINHNCTADTSGSTLKVYQFPITYQVSTLAAQPFTFTLQTQYLSGNPTINVYIYQFLGTGVTSPAPQLIGTITATSSWTKAIITGTFLPTTGTTISGTGDSAYYLQIGMPTGLSSNPQPNAVTNINFALPSLYLSPQNEIPTNSFATYDQIDSIINSARTGDVRVSINSASPYGWVPMNDGTIGNSISGATSRANQDTWPLFNNLWQLFKVYDTGANSNPIAQMYTSGGSATNYGTTSYADFIANKALALTKMMGRVILGTADTYPISLPNVFTTTFTASSSGGLLLTTANNVSQYFNGMPIYFTTTGTLPTGITTGVVYYVANFNGTNAFNVATSFEYAIAGNVISYTNTGTPPNYVNYAIPGFTTGEYAHTQLLAEIAAHTHNDPGAAFITTGGANAWVGTNGSFNSFTVTGGITRSGSDASAANVTQPGTFYNIFMKL